MKERKEYIKERTSMLNYLEKSINSAKQFHNTCVEEAIENISGRAEQKEREKLMLDLNKHPENESNMLEVAVIQWLNKIDFRKDELLQQSAPMTSSQDSHSHTVSNTSYKGRSSGAATPQECNIRVRRPLLEDPTFSGNYRDFSTFWSVFESLIHSDDDLSDQEKLLFLKQALKGKAASSISSILVMGEKYITAINILKKHYDRVAIY
ncbi:hypothetical protein V3C99_018405 [Haemonchus contortus]|uniref:Uncharacterized protein n=1 Tax=Haemonchus contortus TaxID=6289 RepID=A0A7I4Z265_HAECO